ncbi:IS110 family transposase [Pseudomonas aeruginosa]|uniref:IS110 family transposase n=1 Tax=Pseudomonas aeruginosa TaxID=287 RepID=UPI000FC425CF|nr:IS110 family transposase [Pseudomonas aeruginosa]RUF04688.1 IS110 family transposase [Pseudomonas aeruginosa]
MNLSRIGLDLAKQVFQVHGVDRHEHVVCRRQLKRAQVRDFFRQLPPCLVAMEACGSAHYWARELRELGHSYVPVKSAEQQAVQSVHRVRSRLVRARTALCNEVRGLLGEFGLIATRRGRAATMALLETVTATEPAPLPAPMGELLRELKDELQTLEARIARLERQIQAHVRGDARIQRLLAVDGIGPISASAVAASAGDARQFRTGRQFAAWLGLVPRQHSTGGQQRLGNISKRGDTYLRTLLIHGARAVVRCCANKTDARSRWLQGLLQRRPANVVAVALANKNARILWALLSRETCYRPG